MRADKGPSSSALDEPLGLSAPLARELAQAWCTPVAGSPIGCDWYHASWQYLRLLGVFESIRSDDDFLLPALARLVDGGARRFLVSGAADYALLARIVTAAGPRKADIDVTVMDRCRTPLELNAWYARRAGVRLAPVQGDVLTHPLSGPFDVICTHSFLCFFTEVERVRLVHRWYESLAPGGCVITAQRVRTGDHEPVIRYSDEQAAALADKARALARAAPELGVDPDTAGRLAAGYARHHWTWLIGHVDALRAPFEAAGFHLAVFAPPPETVRVHDTPGTPNASGSVRWRIEARKPA